MGLIANCLKRLVKSGQINKKAADDALAIHNGLQGRLIGQAPPSSADAIAALDAARLMADEAKRRKLSIAKSQIALAASRDRVNAHTRGKMAGLMALLTRDVFREQGGSVNVKEEAVFKWLLSEAHAFVDNFRSRLPGTVGDYAGVRNMVRELFGEDTGDVLGKEAKGVWETAVGKAVERMRAGGSMIAQMDEWRLPQFWSTSRVRSIIRGNPRAFQDDMIDAWRRGDIRIIDKATGTDAGDLRVPDILQDMEQNVLRGLSVRHDRMRVIRFQNADAWWTFMSKYGPGDTGVYGMMVNHLRAMSREISLVETLGADHFANFRTLLDEARADWNQLTDFQRRGTVTRMESPNAAQRTYDYLTGKTSEVESELIAGLGGSLRNLGTGAKLGSAVITAVPGDSVTATLTSMQVGMGPTRVLSAFLKSLTQSPAEFRQAAARLDVTANTAMDFGTQAGRFEDAIVGGDARGIVGRINRGTARLADIIIRGQGLRAWTERLKTVFTMEMMAFVAENAGNEWKALPQPLRNFYKRHGVTPDEWDVIRASEALELNGAKFFDPGTVDRQLADKLIGGIIDERFAAVIEPDARIRQFTTGGMKRGNLVGEIWRSTFLFKSFPMMALMTHVFQAVGTGPWQTRPFRLAAFVGMMTLAGAASMQVREVLRGRDPRDMTDPDFWKGAFFYGGGLGIYGDFLYQASSRSGNTGVATAGGVTGQFFEDAFGLGFTLAGDDKQRRKFGSKLARFVENWTPGSNLWYTRLAADRYLFDFFQSVADPDYRRSFARERQRLRQNTGQQFWFRPGTTEPQRPPDFGAAVP